MVGDVCYDCGFENDAPLTVNSPRVNIDQIQQPIKYCETKTYQFEEYIEVYRGNVTSTSEILIDEFVKKNKKLFESLSKKDLLKVLRSDPVFSNAVHKIYYKITGNSPVDFWHDRANLLRDLDNILKIYLRNKPERNNFNIHYVLFYLLKRRNYSVTLDDFPEIRGSVPTQILLSKVFESDHTGSE